MSVELVNDILSSLNTPFVHRRSVSYRTGISKNRYNILLLDKGTVWPTWPCGRHRVRVVYLGTFGFSQSRKLLLPKYNGKGGIEIGVEMITSEFCCKRRVLG